ncbi:hypothetical protein C6P46_002036 [Rhodotorula mucilaginosa]|jgi:antitoxin (DNA-binding transcriptional repressor) of toxin-antitoxin stability system|uniref:Ubiquitin-like domain-containing protein n=1 Tax=Rhodotorula mucilaginosa TaxID=5537 RepID=A0A9P7B1X3_RHOMI|nr:hypothetical protein C6P46_002036 [Rhodotorula mucilaginosa]
MSYASTPSAVGQAEASAVAVAAPVATERPTTASLSSRPTESEPLPPMQPPPAHSDVAAAVPEPIAMREATTPAATLVAIPASSRPNISHTAASKTRPEEEEDTDERLRLELLLVSGERMTLRCRPEERVAEVKQRIRKEWPVGTLSSSPGRRS